jgi:hypothetical protein
MRKFGIFVRELWAGLGIEIPRLEFIAFTRRHVRKLVVRHPRAVVLVEVTKAPSHHISNSVIAPLCAWHNEAELVGYSREVNDSPRRLGLARSVIVGVGRANPSGVERMFRAFGVKRFVRPAVSPTIRTRASAMFQEALEKVKDKNSLEQLQIGHVAIGDLVYDQILVDTEQPTLDPASETTHSTLWKATLLLAFWEEFFWRNNVRAVIGSLSYLSAIPARVALSRGIDVLEPGLQPTRPGKSGLSCEFFDDYATEFRRLNPAIAAEGIRSAKSALGGENISFDPIASEPLLRKSRRTKVLVAPHNSFSDSPHSHGVWLFPDFEEWLTFLGGLSSEIEYDWYLKPHPHRATEELFTRNALWTEDFSLRFPRMTLLPPTASNRQLIQEGINAVLSVHGSIVSEFAFAGVPAILAGNQHPYKAYNFVTVPSTIGDYRTAIENIPELHSRDRRAEVLEHYFMNHQHAVESPFFPSLRDALDGASLFDWNSPELYRKFIRSHDKSSWERMTVGLQRFLESRELKWYQRHSHG